MSEIWNGICDIVDDVVNAIILLLPTSPFSTYELPSEVKELLGYVNYFVPIKAMLDIATAWVACIASYYIYQTILRWANAIR